MADETIYRCINAACGRPAPRRVNFCPWCGTAQAHAGARVPAAARPEAPPAVPPAVPSAVPAEVPAAAPPVAPAAAASASAPPDNAAAPSATAFGHSGKAAGPAAAHPAGAATQAAPQEVPRPPLAAHPPQRSPIRLRWWLLVLALLWGVWLLAKPSGKQIERRIDAAIALARECKAGDAQAELIALRKTNATPEQLQRLQQALNDEAAKCTRRRQRGKAWSETSGAVESALAAANWDKARNRLQAFTRRWGEDEGTRALQDRIDAAYREDLAHREHPLAVPSGTGEKFQ